MAICNISQTLEIFYDNLENFVFIWCIFPVLVPCTKKDLATLDSDRRSQQAALPAKESLPFSLKGFSRWRTHKGKIRLSEVFTTLMNLNRKGEEEPSE
jgi:hypothetical protein